MKSGPEMSHAMIVVGPEEQQIIDGETVDGVRVEATIYYRAGGCIARTGFARSWKDARRSIMRQYGLAIQQVEVRQ